MHGYVGDKDARAPRREQVAVHRIHEKLTRLSSAGPLHASTSREGRR